MSKKCIYCGAELEDDALFCDECGKKQELLKEAEVEQNAKKEAELKAKQEAEAKAKADAIAEAAQKAKEEAEKQAQEAAEVKAKLEAERQAKAEEESRKEKEIRTKAEAEARVRTETEQKERAEVQSMAEKKAAEAAEAMCLEKKDEQKANPTYKAYASLILGILTWATSTTGLIIPLITMLLGIFLGVQALKTTKQKTAIAGLVLNGLMAVLVVAIMIA